jgi:adenylate cyclase
LLPDITGIRRGLPHFNVRMGICTGEVTVGTIGSASTKNYTVIGDTVNLASRLEAANKHYGTRILITEATYRLAQDEIEVREIDCICVFGKSEQVHIYELLGRKGEVDAQLLALRTAFEQGLAAYRRCEWLEARRSFSACLTIDAADAATKVFLERIAAFEQHPPADSWTGMWSFDAK